MCDRCQPPSADDAFDDALALDRSADLMDKVRFGQVTTADLPPTFPTAQVLSILSVALANHTHMILSNPEILSSYQNAFSAVLPSVPKTDVIRSLALHLHSDPVQRTNITALLHLYATSSPTL